MCPLAIFNRGIFLELSRRQPQIEPRSKPSSSPRANSNEFHATTARPTTDHIPPCQTPNAPAPVRVNGAARSARRRGGLDRHCSLHARRQHAALASGSRRLPAATTGQLCVLCALGSRLGALHWRPLLCHARLPLALAPRPDGAERRVRRTARQGRWPAVRPRQPIRAARVAPREQGAAAQGCGRRATGGGLLEPWRLWLEQRKDPARHM
jgi:hypothetical protein